jgi:hypothetical protein
VSGARYAGARKSLRWVKGYGARSSIEKRGV